MKQYSLSPKYEIFDHTTDPPIKTFIVRDDPDGLDCVCLQKSDGEMEFIPPDMALLVAEAMIKMAEHLKNHDKIS